MSDLDEKNAAFAAALIGLVRERHGHIMPGTNLYYWCYMITRHAHEERPIMAATYAVDCGIPVSQIRALQTLIYG